MPSPAERLAELHHRYAAVVFDRCVRLLGNRAEAEEALQETFIAAHANLGKLDPTKESPLPWLYRVATNECFMVLRRRRQPLPVGDDLASLCAGLPYELGGALQAQQLLGRLYAELDERGRTMLVSHFIDGMDQGEVAAALGISRRAVVKRLTLLRERLATLSEVT